jgi:SAM-dependent methyltransferase
MGILRLLKSQYSSCGQIMAQFNFVPRAKYALSWMLDFLDQNGFLKKLQNTGEKKYYYDGSGSIDPKILLKEATELDKKIMLSVNLMNYVISQYPNFFSGSKNGLEILFSGDKAVLWNDYFSNDNSGYSVYNSLGALGVLKWALQRKNIKFLEVGAGTGGASSALIDKLKSKNLLHAIGEYILSDISPIFLRLANRAIMNKVGDDFQYALKKLDFNRPLTEQGIAENGIDVVYGVNTLHVAKNLVSALKNIYQVIKPGGAVILSEYCRPNQNYLLLQEFIFCLLDNYVEVELDDNLRPVPGFLDYPHWKLNLEAAGFKKVQAIFNTDGNYPPDLRTKVNIIAAVIKGEKV